MGRNAIVVDTNVLVHDPNAVDVLREDQNILFIPLRVILELDKLKSKPDIGFDAREVSAKIESLREEKDSSLKVVLKPTFGKPLNQLDRNNPDHIIIASAREVLTKHTKNDFDKFKFISRDRTVRILARELLGKQLSVENYIKDQIEMPLEKSLKEINVRGEDIVDGKFSLDAVNEEIQINDGIICFSDYPNGRWSESFAAIRKEEFYEIIDPDISAFGIKPKSLNGDGKNWRQAIALKQLLDPSIKLVFLQGGAGTGKTLLAIASAFEQRSLYRQIVITRPMIHLEDEDRMGFLPGNEKEKMSPWIRPVVQAIRFLKEVNGNDEAIKKWEENGKITYEALDYIRGMNYYRKFLIIDEAQNLTPHQVKTIITRAGKGTKIVFTGDLGQIDRRRRLDEKSSGLTYAMDCLKGSPLVASTNFKETVRSDLAKLAEELL